jgi:hypothetical protein
LALAGLVLFLVRRRKQNQAQNTAPPLGVKDAPTNHPTPPPLYDPPLEKLNHETPQELPHAADPTFPAMLSADTTPSELGTGNWHTEGERQGWGQHQQRHQSAYEMA